MTIKNLNKYKLYAKTDRWKQLEEVNNGYWEVRVRDGCCLLFNCVFDDYQDAMNIYKAVRSSNDLADF